MPLQAGDRLGRYEVVHPLGNGGMGEVYRARDARLKRDVALKVLPEQHRFDARRLARLEHEARALAAVNHPNIATLYGIEEGRGLQALVMELVEGETLADRLARARRTRGAGLPVAEAVAIGAPGGRCAGSRARARHRPPRPEAGQHQGARRWHGQGAGFRPGSRWRFRIGPRSRSGHRHHIERVGPRRRHSRLHEPRAGPRQSGRSARRRLGVRMRALRDAGGQARLRR